MSLVWAEGLTKSFGTHEVLINASFRLDESMRVGIVGPNGSGKSTLLRLITGHETPTDGQVQRRRDLRVGYLPQEPPAPPGRTVYQAMEAVFADLAAMEQQLHELAGQLGDGGPAVTERYGQLQHAFEARGGYDVQNRIQTVLTGLGFAPDRWGQPLGQLSGGQRTRAYLATLLLQRPDVLALDEPTNHLDLASVEWLERWLAGYSGGVLLVSHDRYFLDRATTTTWEVCHAALETYRGSYSDYLPKREQRFQQRLSEWETQQEYIRSTRAFIAQHLAGQRTKEAQGRRTRLERFLKTEAIPKPQPVEQFHFRLLPTQRTGEWVLRATELQCGYRVEKPLVSARHLEVPRGRKVAIVGPNGSGKSTLLKTLLGELPPLGGQVKFGARVHVGYVSQLQEALHPGMTILQAVRSAVEGQVEHERARTLLGSFRFTGEQVHRAVDTLSGGQRSRVLLARLAAQNANLLALDEPTNHLDLNATETLQEVLQAFTETVLFVTYDRYLVDAVATDIWAVEGDGAVCVLPGRWEDYLAWRRQREADPADPADSSVSARASGKSAAPAKPSGGGDYRQQRKRRNRLQSLQRRHDRLEADIHALESQVEQLGEQISTASQAGDTQAVHQLSEQYGQAEQRLVEMLAEWEQVGEELETEAG